MRLAAVVMIACCACGRTAPYRFGVPDAGVTPAVDAGRDAGVDGGREDAGFDAGVPDAGVRNPAICADAPATFTLMMPCVRKVQVIDVTPSSPSCFVDVSVRAGDVGTLVWDCVAGGGRAELSFAGGTFTGNAAPPAISVCTGTSFPWSDGCLWRSAQRIEGTVKFGATLTFSYTERPDETGCASPCSASGSVKVTN